MDLVSARVFWPEIDQETLFEDSTNIVWIPDKDYENVILNTFEFIFTKAESNLYVLTKNELNYII